MDIIRFIKREIAAEKKFLSVANSEIKKSPKGNLAAYMKNGRPYYVNVIGGEKKYLKKIDQSVIDELKAKRYCQEAVKIYKNNIPVLEKALKKLRPYTPEDVLRGMPKGMVDFPEECYKHMDLIDARRWAEEPYKKSKKHLEHLIHMTKKGDWVRSKGEANICDTLYYYGIPYRYEPVYCAYGYEYAPDIVVYSQYFQKFFYWEHVGKTNDPGYLANNFNKYRDYVKMGLKPWDNLIVTYDGEDMGMDMRIIDNLIHLWFLGE